MKPPLVAISIAGPLWLLACEPPSPVLQTERGPSSGSVPADLAPLAPKPSASPSVSASAAPTSAPIAVPPLYAELFREGTKLELRVETRHWAEGKTKHGAVRASCVVARVVAIAEGRRSQVACTGMPDVDIPDPLSGTWTFTEAGLFHNSPQPDGTSSIVLDDGHLVFGPGPQPTEKKKETAQAEGGWTLKVEKKGEAWCSSRDYSGGDPAWTSICVAEGSGVRSGKWGWTGGTTHEAELSRER